MAPSRSRVICTRYGISARRFGSTGNVRSPSAASRLAEACSARRNRPRPTPSDARCAPVRFAFAGSTPLYRGNALIGGLGVSGDGIEQDDYVTYFGAGEFLPAEARWADRIVVDGVRLPMFKFPRQPEGVEE